MPKCFNNYEWLLLGYNAKCLTLKFDDFLIPEVASIASVSECIAPNAPFLWANGRFNPCGFLETPELARTNALPPSNFAIQAYKVMLCEFIDGEAVTCDKKAIDPTSPGSDVVDPVPIPPNFQSIGYDSANRAGGVNFSCSPLTCNNMYKEIPVNRFGLIDDAEVAFEASLRFSRGEAEPGTYFLFEVWREII